MAKKKKRSKVGRPRGRRSGLSTASLSELQAELDRRADALRDLTDRRDQLASELADVEREIASHGGTVPARRGRPRGSGRRGPGRPAGTRKKVRRAGGRRARNKTSLVDALQEVLTGNTMSVTEVSDAVQKAGYRTTSANFRTIVNQALLANPKVFRKVSRGKYTAK